METKLLEVSEKSKFELETTEELLTIRLLSTFIRVYPSISTLSGGLLVNNRDIQGRMDTASPRALPNDWGSLNFHAKLIRAASESNRSVKGVCLPIFPDAVLGIRPRWVLVKVQIMRHTRYLISGKMP